MQVFHLLSAMFLEDSVDLSKAVCGLFESTGLASLKSAYVFAWTWLVNAVVLAGYGLLSLYCFVLKPAPSLVLAPEGKTCDRIYSSVALPGPVGAFLMTSAPIRFTVGYLTCVYEGCFTR